MCPSNKIQPISRKGTAGINSKHSSTSLPSSFLFDNAAGKHQQHQKEQRRHVLITGGNQGIGLATALALASRPGFDLTIACRSAVRAEAAVLNIRNRNVQAGDGKAEVGWLPLDLASLRGVAELVQRIREEKIIFDICILNAGVLLPGNALTENELEPTFQVNFLGHFLLMDGIVAHQCPGRPLKVVCLTSVLHRLVGNVFPLEKDAEKWEAMFQGARRWKAYALSKFATALLAQHLNELNKGVQAVAVHPGNVRTQMAQSVGSPRARRLLFFLKHILIEPEEAAANVLFCVDNKLEPGQYRHANKTKKLPSAVRNHRNLNSLILMSRVMTDGFRPWETPMTMTTTANAEC